MLKLLHDYALQIPFFLALLTMVLRAVSRLAAPHPRARAVVEAIAAASPDVLRAFGELYRAATGRTLPLPSIDARDAEIARLRDVIAAQAARLQALGSADVRAQDPLSRRATPVPPVALGLMVLLGALGCVSGPRSTDATVKTVLSVATLARDTACGPMLDGYLGRPQPVSLDAPAGTVVEVTQRIRDWLCGDTLAGLLDLARDLSADLTRARPSSAPPAPSSAAPRASPTPAASPPPTAPPEASGEVTP